MHDLDLILTLTVGLAAALVLGFAAHRLRLSPIVGYLLAGIAVGPGTPGIVANHELAGQLAEIGVILLMFGVGLHFQFEDLFEVQRIALPGASVQCLVATVLGTAAALVAGWTWASAAVFGATVAFASTVVLTRVLSDADQLHTPAGQIAIGWLIVQDLFAVIVLVLMPSLTGQAEGGSSLAVTTLLALGKLAFLVVLVVFGGGRIIPWLLRHVAAARSRELFTLTVLVVALGIAVLAAKLFGVSIALGALLAGMAVGRSDFSTRAATEALPMRDAFAVLFFVSVGMLFDPRFLFHSPGLILAALAIVMVGTPLVTLLFMLLRRHPFQVAITLALALAQVGEFSFMMATLGQRLGLVPDTALQTLVATALVSISLNPLLLRWADPIHRWVSRHPRWGRWIAARARHAMHAARRAGSEDTINPLYRAVVVGYGPVGRTLARLLRENGVTPTIIEMNLKTVNLLRSQGCRAVYGDATHEETLKQAGVPHAATLVLSASGLHGSNEVIRLARELNPRVRILARSAYLRERPALLKAGADAVFAGEGEVALAMVENVLTTLGATPEQIDQERAQVRDEFFGAEDAGDPTARVPGLAASTNGSQGRPTLALADGQVGDLPAPPSGQPAAGVAGDDTNSNPLPAPPPPPPS